MTIVKEINLFEFRSLFKSYGYENNFSNTGLVVLYDYLNEYTGESVPYYLDVVSVACDYTEYEDVKEYLKENPNKDLIQKPKETYKEFCKRVEDYLNDKTTILKFEEDLDSGFIILDY